MSLNEFDRSMRRREARLREGKVLRNGRACGGWDVHPRFRLAWKALPSSPLGNQGEPTQVWWALDGGN